MAETRYTWCRICEARCGLAVTVKNNHITRIAPDKENPYTWRDFCVKGRTAGDLVHHPRRLREPMKRVGDRYVAVPYQEAVGEIAAGLRRILDRHGSDAIAFYTGNAWGFSGSNPMFTGAFMDAIGTHNRYNVGSVDHNAWMVVSQAMYGSPLVGLIPDVDECRCFLFVGMNPAESAMNWGSNVPDGWRRVLRAQGAGADLIVVDPRRTPTAERADLHVAVVPGTDWAFLLGVLKVIFDKGWDDRSACSALHGVDDLRSLAAEADLADLASQCAVPAEVVVDVASRFATAERAMCVARTGVSQSVHGTLGEWLSHVLNFVTGKADRPGGRRFEPGYVDSIKLYANFVPPLGGTTRLRGLAPVAGSHALAELPDEITTPGPGQIRALVLNCGNPVVTGPQGGRLDAAFAELELFVALDLFQRESHRHADWLIPAQHFLERAELVTLFGSFEEVPFVQYAARAVEPPEGVRQEWEFFVDVALAMGVPLFGKRGVNGFLRGTRWLARVTGRPELAFDPRWIWRLLVAWGRTVKWRDIMAHPHGLIYGEKRYGQLGRALRTTDEKVHTAPPEFVAETRRLLGDPPRSPTPTDKLPLLLVSRRRVETMNSHLGDTCGTSRGFHGDEVEVHPDDAARLGFGQGDTVRVTSRVASVTASVRVSDAPRPGVVVMEHGWGSRIFDPAGGSEARSHGVNRNLLVANDEIDRFSQIPNLHATPVRLDKA